MITLLLAQAAAWTLTPDGIGPVRIGMTRAQVARAVGGLNPGEEHTPGCLELRQRNRDGIWYMFENGRLSRVTVRAPARVRTPRGIGIGASAREVRRAYPTGIRSTRHEYQEPPAAYLTYWTRPDVRGVRFEVTPQLRVEAMHADNNAITYVEGCL